MLYEMLGVVSIALPSHTTTHLRKTQAKPHIKIKAKTHMNITGSGEQKRHRRQRVSPRLPNHSIFLLSQHLLPLAPGPRANQSPFKRSKRYPNIPIHQNRPQRLHPNPRQRRRRARHNKLGPLPPHQTREKRPSPPRLGPPLFVTLRRRSTRTTSRQTNYCG